MTTPPRSYPASRVASTYLGSSKETLFAGYQGPRPPLFKTKIVHFATLLTLYIMTLICFVLHSFNILTSSKNCWLHKSRPLIADLSLSFKFFQGKKIPYSRGEIVSLFQVLDFGDEAERCEPGFEQRKRRGVGVRTPLHYCVNAWHRLPKFMKIFTLFEVSKLPYCRGRLVSSVGREPVC